LALGIFTLRNGDQPAEGKSLSERFHLFAGGIREVAADRRVLVTSAMEGIQNMSMGALEAFLPVYAVSVAGLNVFQAGLLWGVQIVVTLIAKPLMGKVSDRWGRRPLIVIGMLLCALPFALIPHLVGFVALMFAGMIFGLGEAFVTSSSAALVADFCKARHYGAAMGTFGTIFDVGHAAGPIVTGLLVATFGYGPAFATVSALLCISIPVFLVTVRQEPPTVHL
jgi:MFS family permease